MRSKTESARLKALYAEQFAAGEGTFVIGVDEVGRGSVAGPLTVAAVYLPLTPQIEGLNDSKKLTPKRREQLDERIRACALALGLAHTPPAEIDHDGMAASLRHAMRTAINACEADFASRCKDTSGRESIADLVLIDGVPLGLHPRERCVIKGDAQVACIAAASIVAKVARDALMREADAHYPGYGLADNKGYASPTHIAAIRAMGTTAFHRVSFCRGFFQEQLPLTP
ncbi:MAG: ribonuclease HII [Coriobacteriales bacterium]|jgi:ribonuclease HII|nr:ribonuclease HII [Coriobacteriales bacterium]